MEGAWKYILPVKLNWITWSRFLWILTVSLLSGWLVAYTNYLTPWEFSLYDTMQGFRTLPSQPRLIRIVAGGRPEDLMFRRPRYIYARLLGRLEEAGFVLLNVPLTEAMPGDDEILAEAINRHGKVAGRFSLVQRDGYRVEQPVPIFADAFRRLGVSNLAPDSGFRRRGTLGVDIESHFVPSLALVALEGLYERTFPLGERRGQRWLRLGWKNVPLSRSEDGFWQFWINMSYYRPYYRIITYEYADVLNGTIPSSAFEGALVMIGGRLPDERTLVPGGYELSGDEHILLTVASMMSNFSVSRAAPFIGFLWTAFLAAFCSILGLVHFKRNFIFIPILYLTSLSAAAGLFWLGKWLPIIGPLMLSSCLYVIGQAVTSWKLYHEWNVRSLSIKPLLALAQQADTAANFDEYLRSLWREIEESTGVMLKSTRLSENFSLVQNYLSRSHTTLQQGGESFHIIKNASDTSPRHRMLLPLPMWDDLWDNPDSKSNNKDYVILAWDGSSATESLTSLAALVIFAALHFHALEEGRRRKEMLTNTIAAIMEAVEAKDPTTKDHSKRVAEISKNLARWMRLSRREIEDIHFAAQIHDIGKLGIADSVLKKQGSLTEEEITEMKKHPTIGENIMRPVRLPPHIVKGIAEHHESLDGKGYPNSRKGDHLSMVGKIIKVADVYDALSSRRPYKEPWPPELVREYLKERSGTEFDEQVVKVFLKHI